MKKKCYVYLHKRNDNGTVFYIGKGTSYRVTSKDNRSKQWAKVVEEAGGFTHEKIAENLTSDEAENLESSYILNPDISWELINKKLSTKTLEINKCDLEDFLEYSEDSPSGLRWKVDRFCGEFACVKTATKGDVAGNAFYSKGKPIGWQVCVDYRKYLAHRIIHTLEVGRVETNMVINHIDNNPLNNRLENLEKCTRAENNRRMSHHTGNGLRKDNKTGVVGVTIHSNGSGTLYYVASSHSLDGKYLRKFFSINKLGDVEAFKQACEYRTKAIAELNAQGAGYTERHGT